jgi:hypothetical protein
MTKQNDNSEIILQCKPTDPSDPTTLVCKIVSKHDIQGNEAISEPEGMLDQSPSNGDIQDSVNSNLAEPPGETMTVHKVSMDGKVFLEVLEPQKDDNIDAKKSLFDQKAESSHSAKISGKEDKPKGKCNCCELTRLQAVLKKKSIKKNKAKGEP